MTIGRGRRSPRDPSGPGGRPAWRFHLWHAMAAVLVAALAFGVVRVFGLALAVFPMLVGLVALVGALVALPFALVLAILARIGRSEPPVRGDGPVDRLQ